LFKIPIVCVVTSSYLNFLNSKENKFLNRGKVKVSVLPPYDTKGLKIESVDQITEHFEQVMQTELDRLNKEIGLNEKYNTGYYIVQKKSVPRVSSDSHDAKKSN
jgi:hypothetical protein